MPIRRNRCAVCGHGYYRRNLAEQWTERNPGHRKGWKKVRIVVCTGCQSAKASERVLVVAQIGTPPDERKRGNG
jgi:hypothetical protein